MNKSESIAALATALSKAQGEIVDATKDKSGDRGKYKYADLGQILNIIRPIFTKYGLAVSQLPCETGDKDSIGVDTILMHESGEWLENSFSMPLHRIITKDGRDVTNSAQAAGSIITYARRYALAALAGITQEDNDAQVQREEKKNTDQMTDKLDAMAGEFERKMNGCKDFDDLKNIFKCAYEWARENNATKQGQALTKSYNDYKTLAGWG